MFLQNNFMELKVLFNHYFEKRADESYGTRWLSADVILTW